MLQTAQVVDPISVAGSSAAKALTSIVTKQLQSKGGVRLGSKDERRQVYARFQAAATDANTVLMTVLLEQRLHTLWFGKRRWPVTFRPSAAYRAGSEGVSQLAHARGELLQAYWDLRLVANPAPLQAAHAVMDRLDAALSHGPGATDAQLIAATSGVVEAQREFTDVCRDDLWYLPKRWQVYRPAWWSARRSRRRDA